jgi:hypothetical protein
VDTVEHTGFNSVLMPQRWKIQPQVSVLILALLELVVSCISTSKFGQ